MIRDVFYRAITLALFALALFVAVGAVRHRLGIVIPVAISAALATGLDFIVTWRISDYIRDWIANHNRHRHS